MFKMEQIGLPILEVLPAHISAVEVYNIISKRVSSQLKSSVSYFDFSDCFFFISINILFILMNRLMN